MSAATGERQRVVIVLIRPTAVGTAVELAVGVHIPELPPRESVGGRLRFTGATGVVCESPCSLTTPHESLTLLLPLCGCHGSPPCTSASPASHLEAASARCRTVELFCLAKLAAGRARLGEDDDARVDEPSGHERAGKPGGSRPGSLLPAVHLGTRLASVTEARLAAAGAPVKVLLEDFDLVASVADSVVHCLVRGPRAFSLLMTLALALEARAEVGVTGGFLRRRLGGVLLAGERRVDVHEDEGLESDVGGDA